MARRGFGSVRRLPSGRWQASYLGPDGKRRLATDTFRTKAESDLWLAGVRSAMAAGTWTAPEREREVFGDYFDQWLASRVDLAPRTRELYTRLRRMWFARPLTPGGGTLVDVELGRFSSALVREWYAAATKEAVERNRARAEARSQCTPDSAAARAWAKETGLAVADVGMLSPQVVEAWRRAGSPRPEVPAESGRTQVAQAYRLLKTVLECAVRDRVIRSNPCRLDGAGLVRHAERRPVTVEELAVVIQATAPRYRVAVSLAAWSGLRGGELFALSRRHVDLETGSLRVERALVELVRRPTSFGPPKSAAGVRVVHLPEAIVEQLRQHLAEFTGPEPDALVFTTQAGTPVSTSRRSAIIRAGRRAIDRPDLRWHDLRHTGAVLAASAGAGLADLMARLGHSSARAAMIYQHAASDRDRLIAARLNELVRPGTTGTDNVTPSATCSTVGVHQ